MIYKHTTASRNKVMALRKQNTLIRTVVSLFGLSYGRMVICNQTSKTQHGSIFAANALKCIHVHSSQSTELDNVHDQNRIESSNISVSLNHLWPTMTWRTVYKNAQTPFLQCAIGAQNSSMSELSLSWLISCDMYRIIFITRICHLRSRYFSTHHTGQWIPLHHLRSRWSNSFDLGFILY